MFDRLIGVYLVEKGLLDKSQLEKAYQIQESNCAKLGVIAVAEKLMTILWFERK